MAIGWGSIGRIWERPVFVAYVRSSRHTSSLIDVCGEVKRSKTFANARSVRKLLDHTVIAMAARFEARKAIGADAIREAYEASGRGWSEKPAIGFTA